MHKIYENEIKSKSFIELQTLYCIESNKLFFDFEYIINLYSNEVNKKSTEEEKKTEWFLNFKNKMKELKLLKPKKLSIIIFLLNIYFLF